MLNCMLIEGLDVKSGAKGILVKAECFVENNWRTRTDAVVQQVDYKLDEGTEDNKTDNGKT